MKHILPNAPIIRLQLAADGKWEKALHLERGRIDATGLARWLAAAPNNIALEAFARVPRHEAFVGMRLAALPRERMHEVIHELVRRYSSLPEMTLTDFIDAMEGLTGQALFSQAPSFLEIGKVNAWQSFGALVFWPDQSAQSAQESLCNALVANPRFHQSSTLPYAIECGFYGRIPHWYGHPVSDETDGLHCFDPDAATRLLAAIGETEQADT